MEICTLKKQNCIVYLIMTNIPVGGFLIVNFPLKESEDLYWTQINRYDRDVIPYYKLSTRKELFNFTGDRLLFFRKRMEEKEFLDKLKLYNVFS